MQGRIIPQTIKNAFLGAGFLKGSAKTDQPADKKYNIYKIHKIVKTYLIKSILVYATENSKIVFYNNEKLDSYVQS